MYYGDLIYDPPNTCLKTVLFSYWGDWMLITYSTDFYHQALHEDIARQ